MIKTYTDEEWEMDDDNFGMDHREIKMSWIDDDPEHVIDIWTEMEDDIVAMKAEIKLLKDGPIKDYTIMIQLLNGAFVSWHQTILHTGMKHQLNKAMIEHEVYKVWDEYEVSSIFALHIEGELKINFNELPKDLAEIESKV